MDVSNRSAGEVRKRKAVLSLGRAWQRGAIIGFLVSVILFCAVSPALAKRPFTVADDIGLAVFGDTDDSDHVKAITWSPDESFVAVHVMRGNIDTNRVESELRIFSADTLRRFAVGPGGTAAPAPVWTIREAPYIEGPAVQNLRWTVNSKGLAFLERTADGRSRLVYANLATNALIPLSQNSQDVTAFDIIDLAHYAYAFRDPAVWEPPVDREAPSIAVTGRPLDGLIFPANLYPHTAQGDDRSLLWSTSGSKSGLVKDSRDGKSIILFSEGLSSLRMSPDGRLLVTALPVKVIPGQWADAYNSARIFGPSINAGAQDLDTLRGFSLVSQFAIIDLDKSTVTLPLNAPTGSAVGWWARLAPVWSGNSTAIALPNAFISTGIGNPAPCLGVLDLASGTTSCVERLQPSYTANGERSPGAENITLVRFSDPGGRALIVDTAVNGVGRDASGVAERQYTRSQSGGWRLRPRRVDVSPVRAVLSIDQGLNDPPILVVTDQRTKATRVVWDPNPQLQDVELANVSARRWKDETGREWIGGLYKPHDFMAGKRYPLVIQTHGFRLNNFQASGIYPTAFAAQALAEAGFVVLQVRDCSIRQTPSEGPCQVRGYESAVKQLIDQGIVDPAQIGIVGFSRTCYYVLEALTTSNVRFQAASITDGVNEGYLQYLEYVDFDQNTIAEEGDKIYGNVPDGQGLGSWTHDAPTFNIKKINAPIQIVSSGFTHVIDMWEPYAKLRYLGKPVDLIVLNTAEHVLTTPLVRLASQGGTVDWMRFWLQGYEDPDPIKSEQYTRWRALRRMQNAEGHEGGPVP